MTRAARWGGRATVALGLAWGCADPAESGVTLDDACDTQDTVVCAKVTASSDKLENIGVCRDGAIALLLQCGGNETCVDTEPGVASCTELNTYVPYAIAGAPCPSADARACDLDRAWVLRCSAGTWANDADCTTEIQRCGVPTGQDAPVCEDPP